MSTAKIVVLAAALLAIAAGSSSAATYVVNPQGTGDYPTIQAAILAATDGDIIELADGTYTGDGNRDIQVPARDIEIRGQSADYNNCIIDCEGSARAEHRGFYFTSGPGTGDAFLKDVAVINGYTTASGGGIRIEGANPEIRDCAIANCTVEGNMLRGGGVYVSDGASPSFYFCLIVNNAADYGAGIAIYIAGGLVFNCEIGDNVAGDVGGGMYISGSNLQVSYCDIVSNEAVRGGGLRLSGSNVLVANCNISRNEASNHSGGVWLQGGSVGSCTLVENSAPTGGGIYCAGGSGSVHQSIIAFSEAGHGVGASDAGVIPSVDCCDVYGNAAGEYDSVVGDLTGTDDNFSADPELCGILIEDYRLFDTSPCLETNSRCGERVGKYAQGCDSPVEGTSWGKVKALYR